MPRFYLPPDQCREEALFLTGREAHHALRVLRLQQGDRVTVSDGAAIHENTFAPSSPSVAGGRSPFAFGWVPRAISAPRKSLPYLRPVPCRFRWALSFCAQKQRRFIVSPSSTTNFSRRYLLSDGGQGASVFSP